jgi:hypothetical protein
MDDMNLFIETLDVRSSSGQILNVIAELNLKYPLSVNAETQKKIEMASRDLMDIIANLL